MVGLHGLRGDVKVVSWCDSPGFLCEFKSLYLHEGREVLHVLEARVHKNVVIISVDDMCGPEEARNLIGQVLYIDRDDIQLEEGRYFIEDIVGLSVFDQRTGEIYGKVSDVLRTGANDVYQVTCQDGKDYLIPVIDDVVKSVDILSGRIEIIPIKGLFGDAD